jgi:hypothetical protein
MTPCEVGKMRVWIREFIDELDGVPSILDPVKLFCDNTGSIVNIKDHRSSKWTIHIKRKCHVVREIVDNGDIKMCRVDTECNITNPLTKPLSLAKHLRHVSIMGTRYMRD